MSEDRGADTRLFMQLLVFTDCSDLRPLLLPLERLPLDIVLYKDVSDPQGVGLLAITEDPELLVTDLRELLDSRVFRVLMLRNELTMAGHAGTHDGQGEHPAAGIAKSEAWRWVAWFPLRTAAAMATLSETKQDEAFAAIETACDDDSNCCRVRLRSHALNRAGNDFVYGLHGHDLHHLTSSIDAMRRAPRYAELIASCGPFFVGRALRDGDSYVGPQARW